ncbi:hypothetical protein QN394_28520, partial [Pseudomonas sp. 5S2]|nr:hypothetical protein [Pseudomonas sp. 5S2]
MPEGTVPISDQPVIAIRFTLFKHSRDSFIAALDDASIRHSSVMKFSGQQQASGFAEMISAL